ncbi:Uncharacterised protein g3951 [Pycnogonum litorale]
MKRQTIVVVSEMKTSFLVKIIATILITIVVSSVSSRSINLKYYPAVGLVDISDLPGAGDDVLSKVIDMVRKIKLEFSSQMDGVNVSDFDCQNTTEEGLVHKEYCKLCHSIYGDRTELCKPPRKIVVEVPATKDAMDIRKQANKTDERSPQGSATQQESDRLTRCEIMFGRGSTLCFNVFKKQ